MTLSRLESHLLLDKRLQDRFLSKGELAEKALAKQLQSLANLEKESELVPITMEPRGPKAGQAATGGGPTFLAADAEEATIES